MAKESDNSRMFRSTITNVAFLALVGYFVHQKALSETSLVMIMTLFISAYFGVRAYQHRTEAEVATSQSNPRFKIPDYPRDPPEDPPNVNTATTRRMEPPIPRRDEPPTDPGGRGRYKRWALGLIQSGAAPATIATAGGILWIVFSLVLRQVTTVVQVGAIFQ